jgi:hypothetical protein
MATRQQIGHSEAWELACRRLAPEGLTGREAEALRTHLRECNECRRKYERRMLMLRAAAGKGMAQTLGVESRALMQETLHRLGLAHEQPRHEGLPTWARWVWGTVAALALLVLVFPPSGQNQRGVAPDFSYLQSRGTLDELPDVGLGLSGVDDRGLEYEVVESQGVCLEDALRFYITSRNPDIRFYFLFGLQPTGEVLWYFPLPEEGSSYSIPDGEELVKMVPFEIDLPKRHAPGPLTVVALFSAEPLLFSAVSARVNELRNAHGRKMEAGSLVDELAGLSGLDVRVATIDSEVNACGEETR